MTEAVGCECAPGAAADAVLALARRINVRVEGVVMYQPPDGTPVLALGQSDGPAVGATVASLGHPEAGGPWILTPGTLSGSGPTKCRT